MKKRLKWLDCGRGERRGQEDIIPEIVSGG